MLLLLFQLGTDRYALDARRVVEVLPLVTIKKLPQAPRGVAGIFNYRGCPVPAVDLSALTLGRPVAEHMSTRIIIVKQAEGTGRERLLGLVAENATRMLRAEPREFVDTGLEINSAPYLGPVLLDEKGPIQQLDEQRLLPQAVQEALLFESDLASL